jgi:AcrR family transcriptional regulator
MKQPSASVVERRRRPGGRSARVLAAVLRATLDVLCRSGISGLTFEAVAEQAGVSRTTVYRRWPTKHELVRAALLELVESQQAAPNTGSLRSDLVEFVWLRFVEQPAERDRAKALLRANAAEFADPAMTKLGLLLMERSLQPAVQAVERGIGRGELPRGTDPLLVIEPIFAALHFKVLVFGLEPEREEVERLVELVLAGARTGAARLRPRRKSA